MIPITFKTYSRAAKYKRILNRFKFQWVIKNAPNGWRVTRFEGYGL